MRISKVCSETDDECRANLFRPELPCHKCIELHRSTWLDTMYVSERFENLFRLSLKLLLRKFG